VDNPESAPYTRPMPPSNPPHPDEPTPERPGREGSASPPAPDRDEVAAAAAALLDLVRHLSGPGGCPWDREQTLATLSPYVVEEAHEVADAIAADDRPAIAEELGDLLFLGFFLSVRLDAEAGTPPAEVFRGNVAKMIARHPHVFAAPPESPGLDTQGVLRQWEEGKRREGGEHASLLGKSPSGLPALLQAYRVQEKAAAVGFDWERVEDVIAKLREEVGEVERAVAAGRGEEVLEEIGDLLFTVVNLARFVKTDPEARLRSATTKFRRRFDRLAALLQDEGRAPGDAGLSELDRLWERVKREERGTGPGGR
jgi:ATP diphosphatase